jgi:hypothetical protein
MVFAIIFILGCDSLSPAQYAYVASLNAAPNPIYTIKIISDPPGARIEVDNDYVGDAPIEIQVEGGRERIFLCFPTTQIRAIPIYPGQSVQTKTFYQRDKIPNTILFDMNLSYAPRQYDLNIHND